MAARAPIRNVFARFVMHISGQFWPSENLQFAVGAKKQYAPDYFVK